jgi:subtilisin family serine protease
MKNLILITLLGLAFNFAVGTVPLLATDSKYAIKGQYIAVFQQNVTNEQRLNHMLELFQNIKKDSTQQILAVWSIENFHAFSAKLSDSQLNEQRTHDSLLEFIEADQTVHASACASQSNAVWGLDRIDQRAINLDGTYRYSSTAGTGVDAYIVDTGILTTHTDFGGRAKWGANYADNTNSDCNGHGTHVAGTVGGTTYGVAKKVTLIAVKVLDCAGSGTNTGVISGINYVASQYKSTKRPSVANMSLGGGKSTALNNAVTAAITAGVTFALAAGNENQDACNTSPASTPTAITVGATTIADNGPNDVDERSSFSNFGTCVHILAPGELIKSDWIGSNTATQTISGTSMASPHVCGAAALYLADHPTASPATIKSYLIAQATSGVIDMACGGSVCNQTPNRLLYEACA